MRQSFSLRFGVDVWSALRVRVGLFALVLAFLAVASPAQAFHQVYETSYSNGTAAAFTIGSGGALTAAGTPQPVAASSPAADGPVSPIVSPNGKYVFVALADNSQVVTFTVSPTDGSLSLTSTSASIGLDATTAVAVSSDGKYLYVAGNSPGNSVPGDSQVQQFAVAADGSLTKVGGPVSSGQPGFSFTGNEGLAIAPDNSHLYLTTSQTAGTTTGPSACKPPASPCAYGASDAVTEFPISATDGTLGTPSSVSPGAGTAPFGVSVAPDGKHLYAAESNSTDVDMYAINSTDGTLSGLVRTNSGGATGSNPVALEVAPNGQHLYVTNASGGTTSNVAELPIAADGSLGTAVVAADTQNLAFGLVVTPDGKYVYTGDFSHNPSVAEYSVQADGSLGTQSNTPATGSPANFGVTASPRQAPTAAFTDTPAAAGSASTFDGSGSSDPDGTVKRYDWDWGDSTTTANGGATPSHTYTTAGNHTVRLTVTNDAGCSTATITAGLTVFCNGSSSATMTHVVNVAKAGPTLTTTPSAGGPVGTSVRDVAHLSGTVSPDGTGTVSFKLYGAGDTNCAGPATSLSGTPSTVSADGDYTSQSTSPASPGTYHWIATFGGDANNSSVSTHCSDETVTIAKAGPTLTTTPSAGGPVGTSVRDVAHLSGTVSPDGTGSVSFKLYGAGDANCTGSPTSLSGSPAHVSADGNYTSQSTTPAAAGTYHWIATFGGDANNNSVSTHCSDETVTITAAGSSQIGANLRLGKRKGLPSRKGCRTEIDQARTASLKTARRKKASRKDSRCGVAVVLLRGTIDRHADGETLTLTLTGRLRGQSHVVIAHARVSNGHFKFRFKLPARQTDAGKHPYGGDRWSYTVTYAGDNTLKSAINTGHLAVETEHE